MSDQPQYPIVVVFADGDVWSFDNEEELVSSLEWFDSDDPEEEAWVFDALGRRLRVEVVSFELIELKLIP